MLTMKILSHIRANASSDELQTETEKLCVNNTGLPVAVSRLYQCCHLI
jgi:hypothetical protein